MKKLNYETEVIMAWLEHDVNELASKFMDSYEGKVPFRDFIRYLFQYEMEIGCSVDGIDLMSSKLQYRDSCLTLII